MKKILLIGLLLLIPKLVSAQVSITNTTCPGIGCTDINVAGQGSIGIQITGTWVGTITFKSTIDNSTYTDLRVVSSADTTSAGATTTTANGSFQATITGIAKVRIVFTSWMSGTALVSSRVTNQAAKFGGGVSGSGIITACGSSDTEILYTDGTACAGDANFTFNKTTDNVSIGDPYTGLLFTQSSGITIGPDNTSGQGSVLILGSDDQNTGLPILYLVSSNGTTSAPTANIAGNGLAQLIVSGYANGGFRDSITFDSSVSAISGNSVYGNLKIQISDANGVKSNYLIFDGNTQSITAGARIITSGSGLAVANVGANSCGTTAATIAGNSNSFEITVGTVAGTQCRVTFPTAAPVRWNCVVTDSTTTIATRSTFVDTTHTDFFGAFVAGDVLTAICLPR